MFLDDWIEDALVNVDRQTEFQTCSLYKSPICLYMSAVYLMAFVSGIESVLILKKTTHNH